MHACRQVELHGSGCWSKLLPLFPGRIGKQLRERWNHELRPDINKNSWLPEEEAALVEAHKRVGNCWADIAKVCCLQQMLSWRCCQAQQSSICQCA